MYDSLHSFLMFIHQKQIFWCVLRRFDSIQVELIQFDLHCNFSGSILVTVWRWIIHTVNGIVFTIKDDDTQFTKEKKLTRHIKYLQLFLAFNHEISMKCFILMNSFQLMEFDSVPSRKQQCLCYFKWNVDAMWVMHTSNLDSFL